MTEAGNARSPSVCFHTLAAAGHAARFKQACLLTEQAYLAGERVLVWLQDDEALNRFDEMLWTFGDGTFVPHELLAASASIAAPVQLHAGTSISADLPGSGFSTLVMLRDEATESALQFPQVIEIVDAEPGSRDAGRSRFRFYRDHGSTPQHIEVKPTR